MIALLASEFRRFGSRRLVKGLLLLEVLGIVVAGAIVYVTQEYDLSAFPNALKGTALVLLSVGWLLGASAIGAEWHSGHLATILTWEPRRWRVILAKIVASLTGVFLISIVVQALLGVTLAIDAAGTGSTAGVDGSWLSDSAAVAIRVASLSAIFAGFGFALAAAGRNTAVALGVGFGYLVIVENLVRGLRPEWAPWLLSDNAAAYLIGSSADFPLLGRTPGESGLYLAASALVLLLGASGVFRARDVS